MLIGRNIYLIAGLVLLLCCSFSCVTERADEEQDNADDYLIAQVNSTIAKVRYQEGSELYVSLHKLMAYGTFAIDPLRKCLKDKNSKMRSSAAYVLGQMQADVALDDILELTKDENKLVRYEAARATLEIGVWDAIPISIMGLGDDDPYIRHLCFEVLNRKTGEKFGYSYSLEGEAQQASIQRWHAWWMEKQNDPAVQGMLTDR